MQEKKYLTNTIYIIIALVATCLHIDTFLMSTRYIMYCAVALVGVYILVSIRQKQMYLCVNSLLLLLVSIILLIFLQDFIFSLSGWSVLFDSAVARKEIIRCGIYILCYQIMQQCRVSLKVYSRIWRWIIYFIVAIAILQFVKIIDIDTFLKNFYGDSVQFYNSQKTELSDFRCGSVFINPNVFATYLVGTLGCFLFVFEHEKKRDLAQLFAIVAVFVGLLLSGSRTGLLIGIVILIMYFREKIRENKKKFLVGTIVVVIIAIIISFFLRGNMPAYMNGIFDLRMFQINAGMTNSFGVKIDIYWNLVKDANVLNILLGYGPYNYAARPNWLVDFDFGYFTIFYGLIGVIFYLVLLRSFFYYKRRMYPSRRMFNSLALVVIILFGFTAGVFFNLRIFTIFEVMFLPSIWREDKYIV